MKRLHAAGLPLAALLLVGGVLTTQIANGGGAFEPLSPGDPCGARTVISQSDGIEGLTERLVLLGLDGAACRLDVSRESLTLQLARSDTRTDAQVEALRGGLTSAVRQLDDEGSLPPASELVEEVLDSADLNRFLEGAIRLLPDSVIDSALKTDDVLIRTVDELDVRAVLGNLTRQSDLNEQIEAAVTQAVQDALIDRLGDLL